MTWLQYSATVRATLTSAVQGVSAAKAILLLPRRVPRPRVVDHQARCGDKCPCRRHIVLPGFWDWLILVDQRDNGSDWRFGYDRFSYADQLRARSRWQSRSKPGTFTCRPNQRFVNLYCRFQPCNYLNGTSTAWSGRIFSRRASFWSPQNNHSATEKVIGTRAKDG